MWTRNNDVLNQNMLKHFIYSSFSKSTTSLLCSFYYRYSSKLSSFFCILSFLVRAISINQTFYSATHYLAAVWLDSRHDLNIVKDSEAKESSDMLLIEEINTSFIASLMKVSSFLSCYSLKKKTFSSSLYSSKWWFHVNEKWMHEMLKC